MKFIKLIILSVSSIIIFGIPLNFYSYDHTEGERWLVPDMPVEYEINPDGAPLGAVEAIEAAFNT